MKSVFIGVVCLFVLLACNKPVYKYNSNFEGVWRTTPVYDSVLHYVVCSEIEIDGADGFFQSTCKLNGTELCDCIDNHIGKAVMNDTRTQMKIGSKGYALSIDEEPNQDSNGNWTMKIKGLRYYRD